MNILGQARVLIMLATISGTALSGTKCEKLVKSFDKGYSELQKSINKAPSIIEKVKIRRISHDSLISGLDIIEKSNENKSCTSDLEGSSAVKKIRAYFKGNGRGSPQNEKDQAVEAIAIKLGVTDDKLLSQLVQRLFGAEYISHAPSSTSK